MSDVSDTLSDVSDTRLNIVIMSDVSDTLSDVSDTVRLMHNRKCPTLTIWCPTHLNHVFNSINDLGEMCFERTPVTQHIR